ncbi:hypothetical protein AH4AK4_2903 [Aeromonas hydrophila 4AK4]|nr:hypothetical protein AH4AK4_2903 [Aeromonas hydrophila 4AK4]
MRVIIIILLSVSNASTTERITKDGGRAVRGGGENGNQARSRAGEGLTSTRNTGGYQLSITTWRS